MVAAVTALALVVVGVVLFGGRDRGGSAAPGGSTTAAPTSSGSTTAPTSSAPMTSSSSASSPSSTSSTSSSAPAAGQATVPVYYVVDVPGVGPRLYREFHRVTRTGDTVTTALTEMVTGRAVDPDYRTLWPSSTKVVSVNRTGPATLAVDLSRWATNLGSGFEAAAVQQLVYTATAADPSVTRVQVTVNRRVPPSGHLDLSAPQARAPALDTVANVWILAPEQGATVSSPVVVRVYGTGFEGNVPLRVFRGGTEVASTALTTMMGGFATAQTTMRLPAGSYELRAYNDNGRDATLQLWDTKAFTVR
ncbi:GerMN domain-containing protein [Pedococcus cremeus]|uniref:GerMN domain-containing protein n=1 Tax=Pedococcus cremeus TaxID=587636 RepID=UPI0015A6CEE2|nr:GerMN domain-containing protein [Pedococcus cremeus]